MNIDFGQHPGFSAYVLLLIGTGIAMMLMTSIGRAGRGLRLLNGLFGLGFFGYGFYLAFLFDGGSYVIFFKAFILPVVLVLRTVQSVVGKGRTATVQPAAAVPAAPLTPQGNPIRPE